MAHVRGHRVKGFAGDNAVLVGLREKYNHHRNEIEDIFIEVSIKRDSWQRFNDSGKKWFELDPIGSIDPDTDASWDIDHFTDSPETDH